MQLMWFRSDLRVRDNPALYHCMQAGPTMAVYCLTSGQWRLHGVSEIKISLILRQLKDLQQQLGQLNVPLKVIAAETFSDIPAQLDTFIRQNGIKGLHFNHEYEINEFHCEREVVAQLHHSGIATHPQHDQCLIAPGQVLTQQGAMYKVFSAFKKAYQSLWHSHVRPIYSVPSPQSPLEISSDLTLLDEYFSTHPQDSFWPAGEQAGLDRLVQFCDGALARYHEHRDIPSMDGTSALSPYLAIGAISTRQCIQAVYDAGDDAALAEQSGELSWINELVWRDFYRHLLAAYPDLCKGKPFQAKTENLPWRRDERHFKAWCDGQTGFPLVDAAMRQLNETGWMHNRLRMVVAMFFTKHLLMDWRLGERYFMSKLVDGDLASNNGGWQWSASTGVDAVPYFRIFNPYRQSERFDPKGIFIRKFCPELSTLSDRLIHQPPEAWLEQNDYPAPLVDHKSAVEETKLLFKGLT